ncbi:MAG: hypothetical protein AB1427_03105 [Thermodesulfobacteriota bacterium]
MRQNKIISIRLFSGLSVFLLFATLAACSAGFFTYNGLVVNEDKLILLDSGGPHDGSWQTDDLAVMYRYTRSGDKMTFSGDIRFADRLKYNYRTLSNFDLWVHLINSENKIAGDRNLSPYRYYTEIDKIPFNQTIDLPPGIKAISFSYSGRASEGGNNMDDQANGGIHLDFWKVPNG